MLFGEPAGFYPRASHFGLLFRVRPQVRQATVIGESLGAVPSQVPLCCGWSPTGGDATV